MQRLKRVLRWWPALVVLILVAVGVRVVPRWLSTRASEAPDLTQVFTAQRGNLVAAISPTGEVYAPRQVDLSFDVNKIQLIELNVTPGQKVQAGDVLARIDATALERAVIQAEADLTVTQDNLEKAQNPYTELDLTQAKLAVAQAEIGLEDAKENLEKARDPYTDLDLTQARLAVAEAEIDLADAQESLATLLDPDIEAAQAAVRDAEAALEIARNQLIVVENDPDNAAKLRTLEAEANWYRNNYWEAQQKFEQGKIDQGKLNWEYSNMLAAEERLTAARAQAESSLSNAQNKVTQAEEALRDAQENLAELQSGPDPSDLTEAETRVTQAEYNLARAQQTLTEIEAGPDPLDLTRAETQVTQAEYNVAKARETLAEIEAGPDPKDLEVAQAKLISAQATLEEAQAALEAATMLAPFDSTVISVGAEVDDLVSSNTTVVTLADLSNLQVQAIVDETDISRVEIGQQVEATFDAFPGHRFWGQVLEVPLQGRLMQNVLIYEVPVSLEGAEDVALKPGMTANLTIVVGRRENALLVPAMAVQQGEEGHVVMVQDTPQGPRMATRVEVGLSDGMYVEIMSGLIEGDRVIVEYQPVQEELRGFGGMMIPGGGGLRH